MVVAEEAEKEMYLAAMETTDATAEANEERLFGKVDPNTGNPTPDNEVISTRIARPTSWTGNTTGSVAELSAAVPTKKVGPNLIMKVSAGDMISATAKYFYVTNDPTGTTNPVNDALTSLVGALLGGNKVTSLVEANGSAIQASLSRLAAFYGFINNSRSQ